MCNKIIKDKLFYFTYLMIHAVYFSTVISTLGVLDKTNKQTTTNKQNTDRWFSDRDRSQTDHTSGGHCITDQYLTQLKTTIK